MAGADYGIAAAVAEGLLAGPRVIFGGKALSQTGGHGDSREPGRVVLDRHPCAPALTVIADGVTEVRRAAREQLRRGAHHVKVMLSGGMASPTDRIDSTQYSMEELRAVVEEARAANRYVTGHAYTAAAGQPGLEAGVGCIEHGNLMDASSVALFKSTGAFYVPTLATYAALAAEGLDQGIPADQHAKVYEVLDAGLGALELAHRAGLPIVYGTDLLGGMHRRQLTEFTLRRRGAAGRRHPPLGDHRGRPPRRPGGPGRGGRPRGVADLLVVDGNPLEAWRCSPTRPAPSPGHGGRPPPPQRLKFAGAGEVAELRAARTPPTVNGAPSGRVAQGPEGCLWPSTPPAPRTASTPPALEELAPGHSPSVEQ